jgi:hypothetical protein
MLGISDIPRKEFSMKGPIGIGAVFVCLVAIPAWAHHSLSAYNVTAYKTVDGTVRNFEWTNPHAKLTLVVADAQGHTATWNFEGSGVSRLTSGGLTKGALAAGDKITVAYNPRRDNGIGGFFIAVTFPNGTTYSVDRYKQLKEDEARQR